MSGFLAANNTYNINTENEVSIILSHFNSEFLFNVIKDNITRKTEYYQIGMPNIVAAYENRFKQLMSIYTSELDLQNIKQTREETYKEIIDILCREYNLQLNQNLDNEDYYSIAYYLYSFLVSDFKNNVVLFFTNYIMKEKNYLYDYLELNDLKRSKDTTTIYNKKTYKNSKIAIINANLEFVINSIFVFDIDMNTLLNCIYDNKNIVKFLENTIQPVHDFFKYHISGFMQSQFRPILITDIRLSIQKLSMSEDININNI